jgi:predicted RNase H-like HicB family nuclease
MVLFIGLVHKDPDSCYGISFPDAPGCFSAADEPDAIFAMAQEALGLWMEVTLEQGYPAPSTRSVEEIRQDPEWRDSLETATFVIGVNLELPLLEVAA